MDAKNSGLLEKAIDTIANDKPTESVSDTKGCGFYDKHRENDRYVTEFFGALICCRGDCRDSRAYIGQIDGEGPAFYECSKGDALREK